MNDPTTLRRRTLAGMVLDQLREQIDSGRLVRGTQLPTESELGESFGVGRTTVREALQGLQAAGLVSRQGRRLVVTETPRPPAAAPESLTPLPARSVLEVRRLVEVEGARLAAVYHSAADLAELRRLAQRFDLPDHAAYDLRHRQFHLLVVRMSRNAVLARMVERSTDVLFHPSARPRAGRERADHERIVAAIASGSPAEAAQAMYEHLDDLGEDVPFTPPSPLRRPQPRPSSGRRPD